MRTILATLLLLNLGLAGCLGADEDLEPAADPTDTMASPSDPVEPVVQLFEGVATASPLAPLAHDPRTEPMVADIQREGAVIEANAAPQIARFELAWSTPSPLGEMMIMVDLPIPESNDLVTFLSGWSGASPICMEVPVEHLEGADGDWSLMVHNRNGVDFEYELTLTTVGGDVYLNSDRYHMEVEDEERVRDVVDGAPC